eukprot:scaffold143091_cov127-Phaeocystis_antarctica.AAC.2
MIPDRAPPRDIAIGQSISRKRPQQHGGGFESHKTPLVHDDLSEAPAHTLWSRSRLSVRAHNARSPKALAARNKVGTARAGRGTCDRFGIATRTLRPFRLPVKREHWRWCRINNIRPGLEQPCVRCSAHALGLLDAMVAVADSQPLQQRRGKHFIARMAKT